MEININVVNQKLNVVSYFDEEIAEGTNKFVRFKFNLDNSWDGYTVFAQFVNYEKPYNVYLSSSNRCYLPPEIVAGTCYLILCGTQGTSVATTNALKFKVKDNYLITDINSMHVTSSLYQQLVNLVRSSLAGPKKASTKAAMTNTSNVYVYTGNESGMTFGHWYWHNGTDWVDGGVYNAVAVHTDKTLTELDEAADAKTVGDRFTLTDSTIEALKSISFKRLTGSAEDYNNLLSNVDEIGVFSAPTSLWNDLPVAGQGGIILNYPYGSRYTMQLCYNYIAVDGYWIRFIDRTDHSVYLDWINPIDVSTEELAAVSLTLLTGEDPASYNNLLSNVDKMGIFSAGTANWNDLPVSDHGGVIMNLPYRSNYLMQLCYNYIAVDGYWIRFIDRTDHSVYLDWINPLDSTLHYMEVDSSDYNGLIANVDKIGTFYAKFNDNQAWTDLPNNVVRGLIINIKLSDQHFMQICYGWAHIQGIWFRIVDMINHTIYMDWYSTSTENYYLSAAPELYDYKLANIMGNVTGIASANAGWTDAPDDSHHFVFTNTRYSVNYNIQRALRVISGDQPSMRLYYRLVNRNDGSLYVDWTDASTGTGVLKILACGDSICAGLRNGGKGFVGDLGMPYINAGLSGSCFAEGVRTDRATIYEYYLEKFDTIQAFNPDIIILEGGSNDCGRGASLGTLPTRPALNDTEAAQIDRYTMLGGMEFMLYKLIKNHPNAQRFFLTVHPMNTRPWIAPGGTFTQDEMTNAQIALCKIYNVKVIDVYHEGMINTAFPEYKSDTNYGANAPEVLGEYVNSDGTHPLPYGYKHGYIPLIRQAIGIGTKTAVGMATGGEGTIPSADGRYF